MSRRSNHSAEEKLKIVEACLAGEISICEAGQRAGVHYKTVIRWISRYKAEGPSAFLPSEHNRPYPAEVKYRAVEEYLSGKGSLQNICEKYKIRSEKQLRDWIKVYNCHEDFKTQSGGSHMTKSRKTSQDERLEIAKECRKTGRITERPHRNTLSATNRFTHG